MTAQQEWDAAIASMVAQAPQRLAADEKYRWARSQVARKNPELRQRLLDETNAARRGE